MNRRRKPGVHEHSLWTCKARLSGAAWLLVSEHHVDVVGVLEALRAGTETSESLFRSWTKEAEGTPAEELPGWKALAEELADTAAPVPPDARQGDVDSLLEALADIEQATLGILAHGPDLGDFHSELGQLAQGSRVIRFQLRCLGVTP